MRTLLALPLAVAPTVCATGCSLFVSLDGLTGATTDSGTVSEDAAHAGAPIDAGGDSPPRPSDAAIERATGDVESDGSRSVSLVGVSVADFVLTPSTQTMLTVGGGDLLVAAVYWDDPGSNSVSVSDSLGNEWKSATVQSERSCHSDVQFWYVVRSMSGADTVTVTQGAPSCNMTGCTSVGFFLLDYTGFGVTPSVDSQAGEAAPMKSGDMSTGTLSTTGAIDLVLAVFSDSLDNRAMSAGAGFFPEATDSFYSAMVEDDLPGGAPPGSYNPKATLPAGSVDDCWVSAAIAFKTE